MSESAVITIRRQVLDVEVRGTQADGLALQRRLPGICADLLGPAIESALAPYDPGDAHLSIDRLEIDVAVTLDRLEVELVAEVRRRLADWFRAHPPPLQEGSAPAAIEGEVRRRTTGQTIDDALVTFLGTGRLPWSVDVPAGTSLEDLIMESWRAAGHPPGPSARTRDRLTVVLRTPQARTRLVLQFSAAFRAVVLRAIAPEVEASVEEVSRTLTRPATPDATPAAVDALLREVTEVAFAAAIAGARPGPAEIAAQAWARVSSTMTGPGTPGLPALADVVRRHWPGATPTAVVPEQAPRGGVDTDAGSPGSAAARDATASPDAGRGTPLDDAVLTRPATPNPGPAADDVHDGILVDSAGLVLLHPFLPRFLEGLGLARGEELLDPHRAVGLLHHLATGERTAPEHRTTVAKVLCGLPLDQPVPLEIGLRTQEADEATALLEAVVGHWRALRDTSPDALRGEFLTRPGLLWVTDDGDWLLRVESRTADILLDDLPWGFGMFRLPWMSALMQVEWR